MRSKELIEKYKRIMAGFGKPISEEGKIEILGDRYVVVSCAWFTRKFYEEIEKYMGEASQGLFYEIGFRMGRDIAKRFLKISPLREKMLDFIGAAGYSLGWMLTEYFYDGGVWYAYAHYTFESQGYIDSSEIKDKPVCHLLRGVLAGIVTEYMGKKFRCEEAACRGMGGRYCIFVIFPEEGEHTIKVPSADLKDKDILAEKYRELASKLPGFRIFIDDTFVSYGGLKYLLVNTKYFTAEIYKDLYGIIGDAVNGVLDRVGRYVGNCLVEIYSKKFEDVIEGLSAAAWFFGWGIPEVVEKESLIKVRFYEPFEYRCSAGTDGECLFLRGVILGVLNRVYNEHCKIEKVVCSSSENELSCDFIVVRGDNGD